MKSKLPFFLLPLAALLAIAQPSSAGIIIPPPAHTGVQIFKGTIKANFQVIDADSNNKGSYSVSVYYIQSRNEASERLLIVNPKNKTFFVEHSGPATFSLGNFGKDLYNIRTINLRDLSVGTGSLLGKVKPASFSGITLDLHTPSLAYEFHSFSSGPNPYDAVHEKAVLKIDKAMMNLSYADGINTVAMALNDVINHLASKGYVGLP